MNEVLRHYYLQQIGIEPLVALGDLTSPLPDLCLVGSLYSDSERAFVSAVGKAMGCELKMLTKNNQQLVKALKQSSEKCRVIHLAKEPESELIEDMRYIHIAKPLNELLTEAQFKKQLYLRLL